MTNAEPVTFSLRLPAELAEKLDKIAEKEGRSRSNVIRLILTQALEPKITIHYGSTDPVTAQQVARAMKQNSKKFGL
jgi:metal-responsive CopG/Arc/MetJ family transcriptional regulator